MYLLSISFIYPISLLIIMEDNIRCDDVTQVSMVCRWHRGLSVRGQYAVGEFEVPIMTFENTVNIAVRRGLKVTKLSGGIETIVDRDCMTRAPLLTAVSEESACEIFDYVLNQTAEVKRVVESTTRFGKFISVEPVVCNSDIYLRLMMSCGDAAGHNMAGKAATALCVYLQGRFPGLQYTALSSNYCTDKKPALVNLEKGRGKSVHATAVIPRGIVEFHLKSTPERIVDLNYKNNVVGSRLAGTLGGQNSHHVNIIAAMYLATGQDLANIGEGQLGSTYAKVTYSGDLEFSVICPNLIVGTVGGGTCLNHSSYVLERLGCYGGGNPPGSHAKKLAELIGASVLAGELSTMAELTRPVEFIKSHEKYERT